MKKANNSWFSKIIMLLVLLLAASTLFGDEEAVAILEYADDMYEVFAYDADGEELLDIDLGSEFETGTVISTEDTTLELTISPNGTIIKISEYTTFQIEELSMEGDDTTHIFSVISGQIRTVAAHVTGSSYVFKTDTAVMGVRGTDFIIDTNSTEDNQLIVLEGEIEAIRLEDGEQEFVGEGEALGFHGQTFRRQQLGDDRLGHFKERHPFNRLDKNKVPFDRHYSSGMKLENFKSGPRALPSGVRGRIDSRRQNRDGGSRNGGDPTRDGSKDSTTGTRQQPGGGSSGGGGDRRR